MYAAQTVSLCTYKHNLTDCATKWQLIPFLINKVSFAEDYL